MADSELLAASAKYLMKAGGKRFRPMLVLLAGHFGDPSDPRLIPGSVSIELVHQATLYHDDVIDEADARHGVPSANARWDNTIAILTGDYLFARASEISADLGPDVCRLLAQTIAVLCDGQIREVDAAGKLEQAEDTYLEVIRRKTGVLIAHVLPARRHAVRCASRPRRDAHGVRRVARHGVPALGRRHGLHRQPDGAREGARTGPAGGRVHAPGPARAARRSRTGTS